MSLEEIFAEFLGELILGGAVIGVAYIYKSQMLAVIKELGKLWINRDEDRKETIYSVLGIEANKHHGKEVEGPPPGPDNLPTKDWLEGQFGTLAEQNRDTQDRITVMGVRLDILEESHNINPDVKITTQDEKNLKKAVKTIESVPTPKKKDRIKEIDDLISQYDEEE